MITAYSTLILILLYYAFGFLSPLQLNVIDHGVLSFVRQKLKLRAPDDWERPMRQGIMMFSDQQLVKGIAILGSAYSQLGAGIFLYHWQIIVYLAWFSSLTHLATLTILRQHFREHYTIRIVRVALMLLMAILLFAALLPTGQGDWLNLFDHSSSDTPTVCAYRNLTTSLISHFTYAFPMTISLLFLATSYTSRIIKLFPSSDAFVQRWLRGRPGNLAKRLLNRMGPGSRRRRSTGIRTFTYLVLLALFLTVRAIYDVYASMLWEVRRH